MYRKYLIESRKPRQQMTTSAISQFEFATLHNL